VKVLHDWTPAGLFVGAASRTTRSPIGCRVAGVEEDVLPLAALGEADSDATAAAEVGLPRDPLDAGDQREGAVEAGAQRGRKDRVGLGEQVADDLEDDLVSRPLGVSLGLGRPAQQGEELGRVGGQPGKVLRRGVAQARRLRMRHGYPAPSRRASRSAGGCGAG